MSTCVWRLFAPDFIAPLFHTLFPNARFPIDPRLILSSRILSLLRLAYPSIKKLLDRALSKPGLAGREKIHLLNLQLLFEYYIPKVFYHTQQT